MEERRLRLRPDLVVSEHREGDEVYFILKDPLTGRFFRLKSHEYFIASRLDGASTIDEVRHLFKEDYGVDLSYEKLERFIARLEDLCLLETGLSGREMLRLQAQASLDRRGFRRLFHLRLRAVDPNRFFDAAVGRLSFFFTPWFTGLTILLIIVGIAITVSSWTEYTTQVKGLLRLGSIPTFLLVIFVVTTLHELAHGLTCKHYGGEVHEIGFLLIYFLPAFYCNVSDAWLFKDKARRLWVSFSGMFFQAFVWALATIMWRVVAVDTWLSGACAIAMATSGLTALYNLNPLIKLDGYYLLSDYLGIPNLRRKAFGYLGSKLRRYLSGRRDGKDVTGRERRIYFLYGISAGIYSFGLLVYIFLKIAGFVLSEFHGTGLVVLVGVILLAFVGSSDWLGLRIRGLLRHGGGVSRRKKNLVAGAVAVAVLAIIVFGRWELKISSDCRLLAASRTHVRAELDGIIEALYVDCGDTVTAGRVIARIDDTDCRAELNKTRAEIAEQQAELDLLRRGPLTEEITRQMKLVERARTRVDFAWREFERIGELHDRNLVSSTEHEEAEEKLDVLRKELEHAESNLDVLLKGSRPETIRAAEAELVRLETTLEYMRDRLERTEITSPISGVIATPHLSDRLKEYVEAGDEICKIVDPSKILIEIPVSEKDVSDVQPHHAVRLKARSLPGMTFHGRVTAIAPAASNNERRTVVLVTSEVENPNLLLKPGMTGNAKIYCGKRRIIDLWTRRIVRFVRVEFWL